MGKQGKRQTRVLILGGGFGGVYTARHLERLWRGSDAVQITLVNRDNYFVMTPLLFEAGSGILEPRHAVNPIRPLLDRTRFVEAEVRQIDLARKSVAVQPPGTGETYELDFDHLVIALGGVTNTSIVPGSECALTFKTLGDAIYLRNHAIQQFEQADIERDPKRKQAQLTFVIVGAGLVGLELMGELTTFVLHVADLYRNVDRSEIRFEMLEAGPRIAPEFDEELADYSAGVLQRRGVRLRTNSPAKRINNGSIDLPDGGTIEANTIIVATGVAPSPIVTTIEGIEKDHKGRVKTDSTMRAIGRQDVWALGDCAVIPDPSSGKPYPPLAQHALREAACLAENITKVIRGTGDPQPFVYQSKGTLAALGHFKGAGKVYTFKIHGFVAWWVWRTYYLFRLPRWSRRLRVVIDWTVALFFKNDVVQLDLRPGNRLPAPVPGPGRPAAPTNTAPAGTEAAPAAGR